MNWIPLPRESEEIHSWMRIYPGISFERSVLVVNTKYFSRLIYWRLPVKLLLYERTSELSIVSQYVVYGRLELCCKICSQMQIALDNRCAYCPFFCWRITSLIARFMGPIAWVLLPWRRQDPGHPWYWLCWTGINRSPHVKGYYILGWLKGEYKNIFTAGAF